ncbi:site-specific integrase [Flagellimonas sp. S3867]|uniref:site-specific integrase n=1 Tax=Flagellimonas sp. S3867 TaxID=2768063 RepID=UPI00168273C5|nr:site-specific integrase [Flagellimonas sp. S3867]
MQTSLKLSLDKRRTRKDGTFPIIIRLGHFQRTTSISTGQSVHEEYWEKSKERVKRSYKGVESVANLNNILIIEKARAQEIINDLYRRNELDFLSVTQLKDKIVKKSSYESFFNYGHVLVSELNASQRYGTARSYKGLLGILKVFTKGKDLRFNEVNYDLLKRFERFHLSKDGNTLNGLASYMRTLRAIYNKGIKEGLVEKDAYPFDKYRIRTMPTEKRAIDLQHIKKIMSLNLKKDDPLFHFRNYFLFSYMLLGMSFIDMAFLKIGNIVDGRIKFQRKKTSKVYDIKITEQLKAILKYYTKGKNKGDFILPILKRNTLELQYKDEKWALKRFNKGLKKIAGLCGIEEKLTSYVSRHSFATHAMLNKVPLQAISAMLGHSKLNTTQIYLKSLPNNILDTYQEALNNI